MGLPSAERYNKFWLHTRFFRTGKRRRPAGTDHPGAGHAVCQRRPEAQDHLASSCRLFPEGIAPILAGCVIRHRGGCRALFEAGFCCIRYRNPWSLLVNNTS